VGTGKRRPKRNTRQAILDAALIQFSKNGFEQTNMATIARLVKIRQASIYYHFKSKRETLLTSILSNLERTVATAQEALAEESNDPAKRLNAFIRCYVDIQLAHSEIVQFSNSAINRDTPFAKSLTTAQRRKMERKQKELIDILREILTSGTTEERTGGSNSTVTAFLVIGALEHLPYWYNNDGDLSPAQIADHFYRVFAHGIET